LAHLLLYSKGRAALKSSHDGSESDFLQQVTTHGVMANAAVASWTACVKELQQLMSSTPAAQSRFSVACTQRLQQLSQQPPLPHAAWKKLAQDVQVKCAAVQCVPGWWRVGFGGSA
jgi:hypothetical protein